MPKKWRILLAKPGLDGHDRGIKVIAAALRDAGFEVIYTGLRQTPEQVIAAAIQEDVDAIGLSILSGAHMTLFPAVLDGLKSAGADQILLFGGGIIAESDAQKLRKMGVGELFTPGATTEEIIDYLNNNLMERKENIL
ncbi:MAG: cobalamin B12-binding domain-containing protein [candidate division Zixibacteria bacterium]|nr:cobalamin B12-binding domain-containing protein [candidate division Zixibacteria bacterium]